MGDSINRPKSALRAFLESGAAGGIVLMLAAAAALVVANSGWSDAYFTGFQTKLGPMSVLHWVNDGLMALFFLQVGLEIKREFVDGHLSNWGDRALPMIAAVSGMVIPALVFLAIAGARPELHRGWAIPAATDIAFAMGVAALLGRRVPASLKLLLATVAIVDDMGAVAIIAVGYTDALSGAWLMASAAIMAAMFLIGRRQVAVLWPYFAGFALLWFAVLQSGVHATIAGVLAAAMIPVRVTPAAPDDPASPLHRLEHLLNKPVAFFIVPLFGFANAGVSFAEGASRDELTLAIAAGLFFGKQIGIFSAIWLAVRFGFAGKPAGATWAQVYGMALLCGIGFTMSLFIGGLAFSDPMHESGVKMGVLLGSVAAAIVGAIVLGLSSGIKKGAA